MKDAFKCLPRGDLLGEKEKRKKRTKMRNRKKGVEELWLATPGIIYWHWPWEDRDRHGNRYTATR